MVNPALLGEKAWESAEEAEVEATSEEVAKVEEARTELEQGDTESEATRAEVATVEAGVTWAGQRRSRSWRRSPPAPAGGDTRFQVFARPCTTSTTQVGITLKVEAWKPKTTPTAIDSLVPLFRRGRRWHEREAWGRCTGFTFDGHPKLRHLYLPLEFEGHPLRKDLPAAGPHREAVARLGERRADAR